MSRRIVVAVTGASGALYAVRFVRAGLQLGLSMELVVSDFGQRLLIEECELNLRTQSVEQWLIERYGSMDISGSVRTHRDGNLGAAIASGSRRWDGMVVIPCSMKTLSEVANGAASNLIARAADVTLKERRPLVLVPRETPLNLVHIENMRSATLAGAMLVPAMPAFYYGPETLEDIADFIVGRALSLLGIEHRLFAPWKGETS